MTKSSVHLLNASIMYCNANHQIEYMTGFAPIMGNAYSMLANTIDYGEWKFGIRNDGLVYSGGSFSAILGSGIASRGIG
ncbi:MFS transporter [Klebsiella pneumoniae]|uniref:MFS transporter n=1 Tax=Klebsiella pneumoniae TaxID=573 RepID=UPI000F629FEC|nr:hypothetical protein EAO26_27875 [Klebsiella pneumoniae]